MSVRSRLEQRYLAVGREHSWQEEFVVAALLYASAIGVLFCGAYAALDRWLSSAGTLGMSVGLMLLLERWRVRPRLEFTVHAALSIAALDVLAVCADEPTFDLAMLAWFSVLPVAACLVLGWKKGAPWLGFGIGLSVLGWLLSRGAPAAPPGLFHLVRLSLCLVTVFMLAVVFDVTRQRALLAAEAASRAKSGFLANMSHEIRTPLNGVLGMTEVMLQEHVGPTQREQLAVIQRSGQALVSLINDLLDLSKVEAARMLLDEAPFELRPILEDLCRLHAPKAAGAVVLSVAVDPAVAPVVRGDALRLRQVLGNLLGNAVKFTDRGTVMDGFEATARIRALPESCRAPIIALTASAMPDELEACRRAGMLDCLTKPLSMAALKRVLDRVLRADGAEPRHQDLQAAAVLH